MDVVPYEPSARPAFMASNHTWWEETSMRSNVVELDVLDSDQRLSKTGCITSSQRIEHAPWATTTGLLLLLWADVDIPPERVVDYNVAINDV